jgi:iron(III) transport system substrate-binding protein
MTNLLIRRAMLAMVTLLLLAACGGAPAAPGVGSAATSQPAAETAETATSETVTAATAATAAGATTSAEVTPEMTAEATAAGAGELTVYSGRNEELIGALVEQFQNESGIDVEVRYGDTAELAATILEEGANSPADVFFAQDAGALGALAAQDRLQKLPDSIFQRVEERFRSPEGEWVGTSGRARVVVYNTAALTETDLPETIFGFTDPKWKGRLGWAPTNGSFQAFVTALRVLQGEEKAREWLEGIRANEPKVYDNNTAIVQAAASGEIDAGFVNHYYLVRQLQENGDSFGARNYYLKNGDPGALVNVAGAGILTGAKNQAAAEQFVTFLVGDAAQQYFADETFEYPLVTSVEANDALPPLSEIQTPQIDLSRLEDLQGTLQLLQDLGIL